VSPCQHLLCNTYYAGYEDDERRGEGRERREERKVRLRVFAMSMQNVLRLSHQELLREACVVSTKVRASLPYAARAGTSSCFLKAAPRSTSANFAHLEQKRFVIIGSSIRSCATVEIVATLAFGRAGGTRTQTGRGTVRKEASSATKATRVRSAFSRKVGRRGCTWEIVSRIIIGRVMVPACASKRFCLREETTRGQICAMVITCTVYLF